MSPTSVVELVLLEGRGGRAEVDGLADLVGGLAGLEVGKEGGEEDGDGELALGLEVGGEVTAEGLELVFDLGVVEVLSGEEGLGFLDNELADRAELRVGLGGLGGVCLGAEAEGGARGGGREVVLDVLDDGGEVVVDNGDAGGPEVAGEELADLSELGLDLGLGGRLVQLGLDKVDDKLAQGALGVADGGNVDDLLLDNLLLARAEAELGAELRGGLARENGVDDLLGVLVDKGLAVLVPGRVLADVVKLVLDLGKSLVLGNVLFDGGSSQGAQVALDATNNLDLGGGGRAQLDLGADLGGVGALLDDQLPDLGEVLVDQRRALRASESERKRASASVKAERSEDL